MKKKKIIILIVAIVLVIAIVAVSIILILNNRRTVDPVVNVQVESSTHYAGNALSSVQISLSDDSTAGTVSWVNSDEILQLGTNEYEWHFVPNNSNRFNEVTGSVQIEAIAQVVEQISVETSPTNLSGYSAYDEFNAEGLVILVTFDGGKQQTISTGFEIIYQNSTGDNASFRAGDTAVTIFYEGQTCEIALTESVTIREVETPRVSGEYKYVGDAQIVEFETSSLYSIIEGTNVATDAGEYYAEFELTDKENLVWESTGSVDNIQVLFEILKADLVVVENDYSGSYDGASHFATVSCENAIAIYYSLTELNEDNYLTASTEPIEFTDATTETVYYYIVASSNYNDAVGNLSVQIIKLNQQVELRDVLAVYSGEPISLNSGFVKITGLNGVELDSSNVALEYFTSYVNEENKQPTTSENGAVSDGSAPSAVGTYYVVATSPEGTNYSESLSNVGVLIIQNENYDLYPEEQDRTYSWVNDDGYIAFIKVNENGFTEICLVSDVIGSGIISRVDGTYYFENENNENYSFVFSADMQMITITDLSSGQTSVYTKFQDPEFVGTYTRNTANNEDNLSVVEIYSSAGGLYFNFKYVFVERGVERTANISGALTYSESDIGFDLVFNYTSSGLQNTILGEYSIQNHTLTISTFFLATINGEYVNVS